MGLALCVFAVVMVVVSFVMTIPVLHPKVLTWSPRRTILVCSLCWVVTVASGVAGTVILNHQDYRSARRTTKTMIAITREAESQFRARYGSYTTYLPELRHFSVAFNWAESTYPGKVSLGESVLAHKLFILASSTEGYRIRVSLPTA